MFESISDKILSVSVCPHTKKINYFWEGGVVSSKILLASVYPRNTEENFFPERYFRQTF